AWSPDGTRIADISGQTDNDEIYIQNAGGSGRFQLTRLDGPRIGRPRWSPDGKQILFDASGDDGRSVFIIGAVAGAQPARVLLNASGASFSHNGKWIYFESRGQIWKATPAGANPQPISGMQGASQPVESADGKYILFRARRTFWRTPVEGGKEEEFRIPDQELMWAS